MAEISFLAVGVSLVISAGAFLWLGIIVPLKIMGKLDTLIHLTYQGKLDRASGEAASPPVIPPGE